MKLLKLLILVALGGCQQRGGDDDVVIPPGEGEGEGEELDAQAECEALADDVAIQADRCGIDSYDAAYNELRDVLECSRAVGIRDPEDWADCREWSDELQCSWFTDEGRTFPSFCEGQILVP